METSITHSKIIREIKPTAAFQATPKNHRLRVAAYCRVSTDHEEQETSMENQIAYYEDLIRSNPEWEYAGVFYDDGISGTQDDTRPGFMELIRKCKKGKVDMILVKSLSRFSRNTLQCISPPYIEIRRVLIESRISNLLRGGCSQIVFGGNHHQNAEGKLAAKLSEETILHI